MVRIMHSISFLLIISATPCFQTESVSCEDNATDVISLLSLTRVVSADTKANQSTCSSRSTSEEIGGLYGVSCGIESCFVTQGTFPLGNGCGSMGVHLSQENAFTLACNFHDMCFGRCTDKSLRGGKPLLQKDCDDIFFRLMIETVIERGPTMYADTRSAEDYYTMVRGWGGTAAFKADQSRCCKCSTTQPTEVDHSWNKWLVDDMAHRGEKYQNVPGVFKTVFYLIQDPTFFEKYLVEAQNKWVCSRDTGGTCSWVSCSSWRRATCDKGDLAFAYRNRCLCRADQCAIDGKCVDIKP
eukprot:TRINITY_DN58734_c0_g1_i1.p1 TRINITY_DN58734_c0_g1~~TRINITY_DN58734_c0_g1_i1.p1  ORF type:complete len:298 (-),score=47.15 TRINITY_DN58734_c0_g1_i1:181-1074(-)